jgi:hypothetical protein
MSTESLAELVRFMPDVYGFRWVNHVAMFVVTDAGVILVDANGQVNPRTPSLIKEAIRSVTAQPVRYFVYSHSAFDHSTGGAVFADTAKFVGHRNTVERIRAAQDPTTPVPDIVFDKKLALELGIPRNGGRAGGVERLGARHSERQDLHVDARRVHGLEACVADIRELGRDIVPQFPAPVAERGGGAFSSGIPCDEQRRHHVFLERDDLHASLRWR